MKSTRTLLARAALLLCAVSLPLVLPLPHAQADPAGEFAVDGCPLLGTRTLAGQIFGAYEHSTGGGRDYAAGTDLDHLLPADTSLVECLFIRKWDSGQNQVAPDSDILLTGYGRLNDSAAVLETWKNAIARLGLKASSHGTLHFAEKPGLTVGYRDGLNTIAFAAWSANPQGDLKNVPGSSLRPFVTTVVCAGKKC